MVKCKYVGSKTTFSGIGEGKALRVPVLNVNALELSNFVS